MYPLLESELFRRLTELAQDPTNQTYINDQDIAIVPERVLNLISDPNIQISPGANELSPGLCNDVLTLAQSRDPDKSEAQADSDDSRSQTNVINSNNVEAQADSDNQRSQTNSINSNNLEDKADSDNSRTQTKGSG